MTASKGFNEVGKGKAKKSVEWLWLCDHPFIDVSFATHIKKDRL